MNIFFWDSINFYIQLNSRVIPMGKKLKKKAQKLGFMNYPKTILYSGASELVLGAAWTYTTSIPNWTYVLLGFLGEHDAATETAISKPDRNKLIFFLSPNIHLYIEVNAKTAGFLDSKSNHVQQVNIYDRDSKFVIQIAHIINDSYKLKALLFYACFKCWQIVFILNFTEGWSVKRRFPFFEERIVSDWSLCRKI